MTGSLRTASARLLNDLRAALGADEVATDDATLLRAGCDAFFAGTPPLACIRPRSVDSLAAVLPRLAASGIAVVPRGAALSYSAGPLGSGSDWVAIDLRGMARVLEVNAADRYVRVEAGCTWAGLLAALEPEGLRTPFWGPASGLEATIGGSLAFDAMFFGSARYGSAAASVGGLTVLLADGRLLRTGVSAAASGAWAHAFGPDLTQLFVGSSGAFGIIVEATLPLITRPAAVRFAGFRCPGEGVALAALAALADASVASEALLLAPHLLSVAVEGTCAEEADAALARAVTACLAAGAGRDGEGLLRPWRERPFQPPSMLRDARGRRWVPVHGIVPHSQAHRALDGLERCMRRHAGLVDELALEWNVTCALIHPHALLVEANLYWPDAGNALIDHYLGPPADAPAGPSRWREAGTLRAALAAVLADEGAVHLQVGRLYPYLGRLDAAAAGTLAALKHLFDPQGIMNPGVLGLGGTHP